MSTITLTSQINKAALLLLIFFIMSLSAVIPSKAQTDSRNVKIKLKTPDGAELSLYFAQVSRRLF